MFDDLLPGLRFAPTTASASHQRGLETHAKIVTAAIEVFADRGFEAASTHAIARKAGVNQGLITYYFGTKLNLWKEAIDRAIGQFRNMLADEVERFRVHDTPDFFESIIRFYVVWFSENQATVRLLDDANRVKTERFEWYVIRHLSFIQPLMLKIISSGQAAGLIVDGQVINIYYLLVSVAQAFNLTVEVEMTTGHRAEEQDFVEAHVDLLCRMIVRR